MNKPNCYDCKWREEVIGDAHSCCEHPVNSNPIGALLSWINASYQNQKVDNGLHVTGNPHGIKNGWFNYPYNFDPVWLETCDGFESKISETLDKSEIS
jgi:hypothetical protein